MDPSDDLFRGHLWAHLIKALLSEITITLDFQVMEAMERVDIAWKLDPQQLGGYTQAIGQQPLSNKSNRDQMLYSYRGFQTTCSAYGKFIVDLVKESVLSFNVDNKVIIEVIASS